MTSQKVLKVVFALALCIWITMTGCAKSRDHQQHRQRRRPPVEAIEACEGKQAGDRVEFAGRNGETVQASCQECNGRLVAVPEGMPCD
jgi:hypothetical protein